MKLTFATTICNLYLRMQYEIDIHDYDQQSIFELTIAIDT